MTRWLNESIEEYGERLQDMSDAQLCSEIRYYTRMTFDHNGRPSLRDVAEGTVLQVVMQTHKEGKLKFSA